MFSNGWMAKQTAVHPLSLASNENEQSIDTCNKLDESWGNYIRITNANPKTLHIYDSIHITFWNDKMKNRLEVAKS